MNRKPNSSKLVWVSLLIVLFALSIISITFFLTNTKISAQESANVIQQERKTLRDNAQERDVEITTLSENNSEADIDTLKKAETIVYGRIAQMETTLKEHSLFTTYKIEVHRVIKPFASNVPLEAYQYFEKAPPEPFADSLTFTREGGSLLVNNHRVTQKEEGRQAPGLDELSEGKQFVFFLSWDGDYKTYRLAGDISGAILVRDDFTVKPLAVAQSVRQANSEYLNRSLESFIESLQKKK